MSDEVDYLLSILGKEGYAAMDHWMPTDPADKYDAGMFLNYLEKYPRWWNISLCESLWAGRCQEEDRLDNWCTHWLHMPTCLPCTNK